MPDFVGLFVGLLAYLVPAVIVLLIVFSSAVKVVQEYERGVIFRLGRLIGAKGPGLFFLMPVLDRMVKIDLRVITIEVPPQEVITRDNVTVRVTAVLYFQVVDPNRAVTRVTDFVRATLQIAQTTLRSVLGQSELDEMLSHREAINRRLQQIIDEQTEPWGIKVTIVEVKDLELPQSMQRAMARQAEAEREKRAKIIHADGEFQASQMLANAAKVIGSESAAIQLRYLQTLTEIATEKNSTIIFPVPVEILSLIPHALTTLFGAAPDAALPPPPSPPELGRLAGPDAPPPRARGGPPAPGPVPPPGFAAPPPAPPPKS
ncbi:MAG TPA: slipin family protein [Chloroflexia bacterium]|nr:slipin family protein [Chloroflexia bacterium]